MSRRSTPTKFTEVAEEVPQPIEIIEEKEAVTEDKPSLEPADMATVVQEMDPKHEPELIPDEGVAKIMPNDMMTVQVEQDSGFDTMDTIPIDPRPDGGRAWKAGLFDGLKDCNKCSMGTFCTPCLVGTSAKKINLSACLYGTLACLIPCLGVCLVRKKMREEVNIRGSAAKDCMAACCCCCCAACQLGQEAYNLDQ